MYFFTWTSHYKWSRVKIRGVLTQLKSLTKSTEAGIPGCLSMTSLSFDILYRMHVIININALNTVMMIAICAVSVRFCIDHGYFEFISFYIFSSWLAFFLPIVNSIQVCIEDVARLHKMSILKNCVSRELHWLNVTGGLYHSTFHSQVQIYV